MSRSDFIEKVHVLSEAYSAGQLPYKEYRKRRAKLIDAAQFQLETDAEALLESVQLDAVKDTLPTSQLTDITAQSRKISGSDGRGGESAKSSRVNGRTKASLYFAVIALIVAGVIVLVL